MKRNPRQRLADILDAIVAIEEFAQGKSFEEYQADRMFRDAVERNIERISEATRHLPEELKADHPRIPWQSVAAMGNVIRHAYDKVDDLEIWQVVTDDLAPLKSAIDLMIRKVDRGEGK